MKTLKIALSFLLVFCMMLSLGGITAFAEDVSLAVVAGSEGEVPDVTLIGYSICFDPDTGVGSYVGSSIPLDVTLNEDHSVTNPGSIYDSGGSGIYAENSTVHQTKSAFGCKIDVGVTGVTANNSTVTVDGDVSGGNTGVDAYSGSTVTVVGDVTGGTAGINVDGGSTVTAGNVTATNGDGVKVDGAANVTIDGTLTVTGGTPILLGDSVAATDAGNINITVWEIQGQAADGSVVSGGQNGAAAAVQQNIDYVVKIATDETSQSVFGGNPDTMKSGQQQVKITVPENYTLKSAFATDGTKVEITQGADGNYYAVIPTTGGIFLHAEIERIAKPQPASEPVTVVVSYPEVQFTFDLDGGTLDGETGKVTKWFFPGQTMELPEAPTREGFRFAGWETVVKGEKVVLQPGDLFKVNGAASFTALWTEA